MVEQDDILLCNCAECGKELLGELHELWREVLVKLYGTQPPRVAGRIFRRPYCAICLHTCACCRIGTRELVDEVSAGQELAIRNMEELR